MAFCNYRIPIEIPADCGGLQPGIAVSRSLPMSAADGELPTPALDVPDLDGHLRGKYGGLLVGEAEVLGGDRQSIAHMGSGNDQRTFAMWIEPTRRVVHVPISTTADYNEGLNGTTPLPLGRWFHVAYVKQGGELRAYLDGNVDARTSLSADMVPNTGPVYFGQDPAAITVALLVRVQKRARLTDWRAAKSAISLTLDHCQLGGPDAAHSRWRSPSPANNDPGRSPLGRGSLPSMSPGKRRQSKHSLKATKMSRLISGQPPRQCVTGELNIHCGESRMIEFVRRLVGLTTFLFNRSPSTW
jgi:hypothetical protein